MTASDERDKQISHLIRSEIVRTEHNKARLSYAPRSPEAALLDGKVTGLRLALSFVDPQPWR